MTFLYPRGKFYSMLHDNEDCSNIHIEVDYNTGAKLLEKWYNEVFSRQHPNMSGDFELFQQEWEGKPVLEIIAHNPGFLLEHLLMLFHADTAPKSEDTPTDLKVVN